MSDFRQWSLIDFEPEASPLTVIKGLSYQPDFITPELEEALIDYIGQQSWDTTWKRRIQQYGSRYGTLRPSQAPIPAWFRPLCEQLADKGLFDAIPDQVIINEYLPGQGIAPHRDQLATKVASLSLEAPVVMDFIGLQGEKLSHLLEPRSLLILSDDAHYQWKHGIAPRKTDTYHGMVIERKRRISCTFRTMLPAGEGSAKPPSADSL